MLINSACFNTLAVTCTIIPDNHLCKNSKHLITYTHTYSDYDSIFTLKYMHFHLIQICTLAIYAELKNLVSFTTDIKLNTFKFIFLLYLEYKFGHIDHQ